MQGNNNNIKKEFIDIPLNIDQTPLHLFERLTQYKIPSEAIDIGFDFICKLDDAIRSSDSKNQLLSLYLNYFEIATTQKFTEKDWPACFEIEAQHQDRDFNARVQTLYEELRLRSIFEKANIQDIDSFIDTTMESWETYSSIFERESKDITFPPIVTWDIFENFLYKLGKYHQIRLSLQDKNALSEKNFSGTNAKRIFTNMIGYLNKDGGKINQSKQNFGYFSIVALATVEVYEGKYEEALKILSRISLTDLSIYSRSIGVLLSLFLTATYAYFMLQQYKQSARLAEMFLVFYQKNKKYFTGSLCEKLISNKFEKLAGLLCLSYIFLEEKPKTVILQIFKATSIKLKDKVNKEKLSDKYTKLRQNDVGTFVRIFQHSSLPSINTQFQKIQESVLLRFKALQKITLNTILQHYTQISTVKVSKMLGISEEQIIRKIETFNKISTGEAPWDKSIMQPLLNHTRKIHVQVSQGIIKLDTDETNANEGFNEWQQYKKQISWLVQKVNSL